MKELTCIGCPRGCLIHIEENDGEYIITGNTCKRGHDFALSEMTCPMRTVCSTVKTVFPEAPVLPVRVSADIPKERIFDVMAEIDKVMLTDRVKRGEVIIPDVLGLGVDVIATSGVLTQS